MLILIMEIQRKNGSAEGSLEKQKTGMRGPVALRNSKKLK